MCWIRGCIQTLDQKARKDAAEKIVAAFKTPQPEGFPRISASERFAAVSIQFTTATACDQFGTSIDFASKANNQILQHEGRLLKAYLDEDQEMRLRRKALVSIRSTAQDVWKTGRFLRGVEAKNYHGLLISAHDESSSLEIRVQLREKGPWHVLPFATRIEGYPNIRYSLHEDTFISLREKNELHAPF